ncbi:unnamed protein product [Callosobruchus maculatus]|nr:unnamed protein product [Callosobruchus maculatus]
MEECKIESRLFMPPMTFEAVYGSSRPSFTDFAAPGVLLTIVFFLAVGLTATALIIERLDGLLNRAYVAGVTPSEILLSHVLTQFIIMVGQTILALIFMIAVFEVDCIGSMALVISITLLQGLCGMCFGFVISAVCSQERNAIQLALGSFYPAILLSGVMWPLEAMPVSLRYVSLLFPITQATRSLRSVMLRGWGITWPRVYWGYVSTCIWIIIFLIISLLAVKFRRS